MPDGSAHLALPPSAAPAPAASGLARRYALPAAIAVALHAAAVLPFVWDSDAPPPPSIVESVEIAPVPEATAPEQATATSVTESVEAAPPEPVEAPLVPPEPITTPPPPDAARTSPPERIEAAAPPESQAPPRPPEPVTATPPPELAQALPPEPVQAGRPPEPVPAETPEIVTAEPPPDTVAATLPLPLPPPPAPPPPPETIRATPPPRPAPRPQPRTEVPPAPAEAPSAASAPAAAAPAPAVRRPPPSYVGALLAALERHKTYPQDARWRRAEGTAILRFAMRRDGTVTGWRIERSTGHEDLDAAVEGMIRRASPLPAPPPKLPGDPVELVVPVRFSLR